jgi:phosphate transport system permease protein
VASTTVPQSGSSGGPAQVPLDLSGKRFLLGCSLLTVATTIGIIGILLYESFEFFRHVSIWKFLTGTTWTALSRGDQQQFGVLPLVTGTLTTAFISALISIPLGLSAAIYLSEYAGARARSILKPVLELLAGVPTIVYGFFALTYITPVLLKPWLKVGAFNGLSAGIAIGIMTLPMVASLSEDALRAVPRSLREAAYGLGATKFETSVRVVVPAAISGIIASFILAISRAVGETMIVAVADTFSSDVARGSSQFYSLFGVGLLLFVMTFLMNVVSQWVARRYREVYE